MPRLPNTNYTPTNLLERIHNAAFAQGDPTLGSSFVLVPDGRPDAIFTIKSFPVPPPPSPGPSTPVAMPGGVPVGMATPGQVMYEGPIEMHENHSFTAYNLLQELQTLRSPYWNGWLYLGASPEDFTRAMRLKRCTISCQEPRQADYENNSQLMLTGTITYHFYGDTMLGPGVVR